MAPTTYEVDPEADTVTTLTNPSKQFARWESSVEFERGKAPRSQRTKFHRRRAGKKTENIAVEPDPGLEEAEFKHLISLRKPKLASP